MRFVVEGSVDRETLDECVEDACGGWVEVLLECLSAAGHPGVGDIPVGGIPGGQRVELVGENEVALVAEYDVGDGVGDCLFSPTWAKLVRTLVDGGQCLADLVGQWVFGGHGVAAGIDLDGAVAA
jgi:hypothetical protein